METVEIRQNRKKVILTLVLFIGIQIVFAWFVFFSKSARKPAEAFYYIYGLSLVGAGYMFYYPIRSFIKKEPILVFTKNDIIVNERGKEVSFLWKQILTWEVKKGNKDNYFLYIETADTKKQISLGLLEKTPFEIEMLMMEYAKKTDTITYS